MLQIEIFCICLTHKFKSNSICVRMLHTISGKHFCIGTVYSFKLTPEPTSVCTTAFCTQHRWQSAEETERGDTDPPAIRTARSTRRENIFKAARRTQGGWKQRETSRFLCPGQGGGSALLPWHFWRCPVLLFPPLSLFLQEAASRWAPKPWQTATRSPCGLQMYQRMAAPPPTPP